MILLLTIVIALIFILIAKFILPLLIQNAKLKKEYRNITLLQPSSIPFIGNVHQLDTRTYMFHKLLLQLSKESQEKDIGAFCIWYSLWPAIFLCSAKGLEVITFYVFLQNLISSIDIDIC
jgi:hypothetical protein